MLWFNQFGRDGLTGSPGWRLPKKTVVEIVSVKWISVKNLIWNQPGSPGTAGLRRYVSAQFHGVVGIAPSTTPCPFNWLSFFLCPCEAVATIGLTHAHSVEGISSDNFPILSNDKINRVNFVMLNSSKEWQGVYCLPGSNNNHQNWRSSLNGRK